MKESTRQMLHKAITRPDKAISWVSRHASELLRFYARWAAELTLFTIWHTLVAMICGRPEITIVVVGRNDNYQGDFRARLEATLSWNLSYIVGEAIYVEWNPLPGQPSDAEWLVKRFPSLRVYVVPPEIHERCCSNPNMPMMEYFAKNVGIRRARTPWICVMNADVAFGPEVINRLHRLKVDSLYGTNRVDLQWEGEKLSMRLFANRRLYSGLHRMNKEHNYIGDFLLAHRDAWRQAGGYDESLTDKRAGCDRRGLAQLYHYGITPHYMGVNYHLDHAEAMRYGRAAHHGDAFEYRDNLPYRNDAAWGLADAIESPIGERVWLLRRT